MADSLVENAWAKGINSRLGIDVDEMDLLPEVSAKSKGHMVTKPYILTW